MRRILLCAALLPLLGCDWILGIEPPALSDAAVDGSSDGAPPDGATGFCAEQINPAFCDDFDNDGGVTAKWDTISGPDASFLQIPTDGGSPPYALVVSELTPGASTFLTKSLDSGSSTATLSFKAKFPCIDQLKFFRLSTPPYSGTFEFKVYGSTVTVTDSKTSEVVDSKCSSIWQTFKLELDSSGILVTIDGQAQPKLNPYDGGAFTGLTLQAGIFNAPQGGAEVFYDNVLVF